MSTLKELGADKELLSELRRYFVGRINIYALEKVFNKEDVTGIADAKAIIDETFGQLDTDFSPKPKVINRDNAR